MDTPSRDFPRQAVPARPHPRRPASMGTPACRQRDHDGSSDAIYFRSVQALTLRPTETGVLYTVNLQPSHLRDGSFNI